MALTPLPEGDPSKYRVKRLLRTCLVALEKASEELPDADGATLADAMIGALGQPDLCDLAVHALRRRRVWGAANTVLAACRHPSAMKNHQLRQAVIRYALACPSDECRHFVAAE